MRKISIEQYVRLVNYFIDQMVHRSNTEDDQNIWKVASYILKEYYAYQNVDEEYSARQWGKLDSPIFTKAMSHIKWFLAKEGE